MLPLRFPHLKHLVVKNQGKNNRVMAKNQGKNNRWGVTNARSFTNPRDRLIAKIALQGGKRINEVLTLTTEQIAWDKSEITFVQSKTKREQ